MLQRVVLTGAPGSGKTTLLRALHERGHAVVEEAATDVIAQQQACGFDEPWTRDDFTDLIVALQRLRQTASVSVVRGAQLFDRYLQHSISDPLQAEVDRVVRQRVYERDVLLVRPLGFVVPTAARRISYEESLAFQAVHEAVYREHGFNLVDIAAGSISDRVTAVEAHLRAD